MSNVTRCALPKVKLPDQGKQHLYDDVRVVLRYADIEPLVLDEDTGFYHVEYPEVYEWEFRCSYETYDADEIVERNMLDVLDAMEEYGFDDFSISTYEQRQAAADAAVRWACDVGLRAID